MKEDDICSLCGDAFPPGDVDEATELCESCYDWTFGDED